jgi:hypothetical protein
VARETYEHTKHTHNCGANRELAIEYNSVAIHVIIDDSTMILAAYDILDDRM